MYRQILDRTNRITTETTLDEVISKSDLAQMRKEIAEPDVGPCEFDVTFEAWLQRISLWGKVNIFWTDPENKIRKKRVNKSQFLSRVTDDNMLRMFGRWKVYRTAINKVEWERSYIGIDNKRYTEKFDIIVDLKPELRKAL